MAMVSDYLQETGPILALCGECAEDWGLTDSRLGVALNIGKCEACGVEDPHHEPVI